MHLGQPIIAVVTRDTRLAELKARWATAKQAAFRLKQAVKHEKALRRQRANAQAALAAGAFAQVGDFEDTSGSAVIEFGLRAEQLADENIYADEDKAYQAAMQRLMHELDIGYPLRTVDRSFLPNFDFGRCMAVVVVGQDGLVANTAKYVDDLPIIGVNPDPRRNDGVLLPFKVKEARAALQRAVGGKARLKHVTLAEVNTNDGQRLLAFNDFFVGANSHVSARYTLEVQQGSEPQSSSGIVISTGAGSTGWMSSMFNMAQGLCRAFGGQEAPRQELQWDDRRLLWAVREPFCSNHSSARFVAGVLQEPDELIVGSQMPNYGVIFSDGVESDFLEFNSGTIARFGVSSQRAKLVVG